MVHVSLNAPIAMELMNVEILVMSLTVHVNLLRGFSNFGQNNFLSSS